MLFRKEAAGLLAGFGLACIGCLGTSIQELPALSAAGATPWHSRLSAQVPATPPLRIPAQPIETPTPASAERVQDSQSMASALPAAAPAPSRMPVNQAASAEAQQVPEQASLRRLHRLAAQRYAALDSYIARLRRREQVNGKDQPEELLLFKFRKQPWSVYFKWLGNEAKGREVVYVQGRHGNMIHTLLAAGDMPLMPAGKRMALAPDNVFVRSSSRHAITEAGIGFLIDRFGALLDAIEKGEKKYGTVRYLGRLPRPEFEAPVEGVEQTIPPGYETQLPAGGRRLLFFDPVDHLPALMITCDEKGHQVEYYCYDRIQENVKLDDDDFNSDKLWPGKR